MPISKKDLCNLYLVDMKSMQEIALLCECSVHKVEYRLKKYKITRRSRSEANYQKYNPDGDPFQIKDNLSLDEEKLLSLAIGLYWGEGGKTNYHSARLTNSDPNLVLTFFKFLTTICQVQPSRIHFDLQTFKDNNIHLAKDYWADKLNIPNNVIHTSRPIPSQGKGTYKKISFFGIMTISVHNTHFRKWMMEQLFKLGYNPDK